jgi:hypothetical protein
VLEHEMITEVLNANLALLFHPGDRIPGRQSTAPFARRQQAVSTAPWSLVLGQEHMR